MQHPSQGLRRCSLICLWCKSQLCCSGGAAQVAGIWSPQAKWRQIWLYFLGTQWNSVKLSDHSVAQPWHSGESCHHCCYLLWPSFTVLHHLLRFKYIRYMTFALSYNTISWCLIKRPKICHLSPIHPNHAKSLSHWTIKSIQSLLNVCRIQTQNLSAVWWQLSWWICAILRSDLVEISFWKNISKWAHSERQNNVKLQPTFF